jgi:DNA-binding CsgD family transcriptional regulator
MHDRLFVKEVSVDLDTLVVPSPEERLFAKGDLHVLAQLKLSAAQREVVMLTGTGHTAVEIGAKLGLVPDTVATHIRRARAVFRKALQKRGR